MKGTYSKSLMVSLDVLQDSNISQSQKLVLSLIIQLDNDMGCYATNDYMAGFLGISKRQVQKHIHNLILSKYLPEPIYRIQKLGNREQTLRVFRGVSKVTSQEQKGQLGVSKASPKGIEERLILFTDDVEKVIKSTKVLSQFEKDEIGNLETYKDIWEIKSGSRCHGALLLPTKPSIKIAV